jgi:hypothetical protein
MKVVFSGAFDWFDIKTNNTYTHKLTGTKEFWSNKRLRMPINNSFIVNYDNVPLILSFINVANLSIPAYLEVDDSLVDATGKYIGPKLFKDYGPFTPFQVMY